MQAAIKEVAKWGSVQAEGAGGRYGPEWLTAAAIRLAGQTYTGPGHVMILRAMRRDGYANVLSVGEQGFVTNTGRFLDRREAGVLAMSNGQVRNVESAHGELESEELWRLPDFSGPQDPLLTVRCYQEPMNASIAVEHQSPEQRCLADIKSAYAEWRQAGSMGQPSERSKAARDTAVASALREYAGTREIAPGRMEAALLALEQADAIAPFRSPGPADSGQVAAPDAAATTALREAVNRFGRGGVAPSASATRPHMDLEGGRDRAALKAIAGFVAGPNPLQEPLAVVEITPPADPRSSVDRAHDEGYSAGYDGSHLNQYPRGTPEHQAFERGRVAGDYEWRNSRREIYDRAPAHSRDEGLDY